jgi:hypothetical protein
VGSTSAASKQGTENHERVELDLDRGGLSSVPSTARAFLEPHDPSKWETEVAYAIDVETGNVRVLGKKLGRNYPATTENEIKLTLDLVLPGGVLDWKSRTRVTPAKDNLQVRAGVYAAWKTQGEPDEMFGGLSYLADDFTDAYVFDVFSMGGILEELREIVRGVKKWTPSDSLHEGEWCKYCPRFTSCDPKLAMIFGMSRGVIPGQTELEAGDIAGAYEALKRAQDALDRIDTAIKDAVKNGNEVFLQDGKKKLVVTESSRSSVDQNAVKAKYAELGLDVPMKSSYFTKVEARVVK